jgi:myo-inositol-1(or 4)-monophosphatase
MMQSSHVWTIDPIDGSSNFSRGIPHFAVCLGLSVDGVPVAGAVYNPITEELFSFEQGKGAWRNGEPLVPTTRTTLAGSTLLFTIGSRRENWPWGLSLYEKLLHAEARVRNLGASALDVCYVAAGRVDGVVYGGGSLRDISCAVGILRASGGEVYLFETGDIAPLDATPRRIIATGSEVFASTIRLLN